MQLCAFSPDHHKAIEDLFTQVFTDSEGPAEGSLVGQLASDLMASTEQQDLYGFVAMDEQQDIVGSIFFSRLKFASAVTAFLLSPVAVQTAQQGKGIGQQLLRYGINQLKDDGVELIVTYGDPDYYSRVGFHPVSEKILQAPLPLSYPHGWLAQSLVSDHIEPIAGKSMCVEALNHPDYW